MGGVVAAGKHGDLAKEFSLGKNVEDLFFSVQRNFKDFNFSRNNDVKAISLAAFGKECLPLSVSLINNDIADFVDLFSG